MNFLKGKSQMNRQALALIPVRWMSLSILLSTVFFGFACQKGALSDQERIDACIQRIARYDQQNPFAQVESKFFMDQKSRGILHVGRLKWVETKTENVSKKRTAETMKFQFKDQKQILELRNTDETGGMRLEGSNRISYDVYCQVTWDLFAKKPVEEKIWLEEIDLDAWTQKMEQLKEDQAGEDQVTFESMQKEMNTVKEK